MSYISGYAHMGPPVGYQLGDIWEDIGKGIDAAKSVKDIISGHAPVLYPIGSGPQYPTVQPQPTIMGMNPSTVLWVGVGAVALLLLVKGRK